MLFAWDVESPKTRGSALNNKERFVAGALSSVGSKGAEIWQLFALYQTWIWHFWEVPNLGTISWQTRLVVNSSLCYI